MRHRPRVPQHSPSHRRPIGLARIPGALLAAVAAAALAAGCASGPGASGPGASAPGASTPGTSTDGTRTGGPSPTEAVEWAEQRLPISRCTADDFEAHEGLLCGRFKVYEDREAASGRQIELFVVVVPALTRQPKNDPILYFEGGPGGAATDSIRGIQGWPMAQRLRRHRDLVFVDQRGTGRSHGLDCDVAGSPEDPQGYFEPVLDRELVVACREQLEQKADLTLYTTSIAMDDIDELRRFLGYDPINAFGGSYGTRAIQVLMRRHPESVRSAVLVGVAAMHQTLPLYHARDGKRGADLVFEACAADSACSAAFPNAAGEFRQVIDRLREEPVEAEVTTPAGDTATVRLGAPVFAETSRFFTYAPSTAAYLPLVAHLAHEGDYGPFLQLGQLWRHWMKETMYYGLWMSVTCAEDLPYFGPEDTARETAGTYLADHRIAMQKMSCEEWPRGEIPAGYHDPVTADVPVLLISGNLDPVTPPSWADEVDRHLPNSLHVVIPQGHHGFSGLSNQECHNSMIVDFYESASLAAVDGSCVGTMERPPFATETAQLTEFLSQVAD